MKVAVMGDLHYPLLSGAEPDLKRARDSYFATVLRRFLRIDAAVHANVGDLVQDGVIEEYEQVYGLIRENGHSRQFFSVFGNHDTRQARKADIAALRGHERYGSLDAGPARLLFLDGATEGDVRENRGLLDDGQIEWLKEQVATAGDKTLLVFCHYPVPETTIRSIPEHSVWGFDLHAVLRQHRGIGIYLNGHVHYNSIVKQDNWHFVQTTCVYDWPAFRTIEIGAEEIVIDYVPLDDERLQQQGETIQRHIGLPVRPYSIGEECDRRLRISR